MTQTQKITARIEHALNTANAGQRVRLLGLNEIAQVLSEAMSNLGHGYTSGGRVANAYARFGKAYSTKAFAIANGPDYIALKIERIGSNASDVTFAGPTQSTAKSIDHWQAQQTLYTLRDWLILSRAECKLFIRSITSIPLSGIPAGITVTLADSLAAGNCRMTSERVASWFAPRTEVPARELARTIMSREPLLAPFAKRAIEAASRKVVAA